MTEEEIYNREITKAICLALCKLGMLPGDGFDIVGTFIMTADGNIHSDVTTQHTDCAKQLGMFEVKP